MSPFSLRDALCFSRGLWSSGNVDTLLKFGRPQCFAIMVSMTLPRRWPRFSLRTALVGLTLFCVWAGYVGIRCRGQRAAADSIEQLGGFAAWKKPGPVWLQRLLGHDPFAYVWEAGFVDAPVRDEDLIVLENLYALERLVIAQNNTFTGTGLQYLAGLNNLRVVYLYEVPVTDEGLAQLPNLPGLEELDVLATQITDAAIEHLAEFHSLTEIQLGSDRLSKEAVAELDRKLTNAQVSWSGQGFSMRGAR